MSVELEPAELGFKRPYTNEVSQVLRLRNPNREPVAFKVKTTAPKQYCVRPNSGKIEPGEYVDVSVVLQPMKTDPPPDARCKDKFLVQSVTIPADKDSPVWQDLERSFKAAIQERKIRVHYLPAEGESHQANGVDEHIDDSVMTAPPPVYTPQAPNRSTMEDTPISRGAKSTTSDTLGDQTTALSSSDISSNPSREALAEKVAELEATIARLRRDGDQGLRQRKVDATSSDGSSRGGVGLATQTPQVGVPVPTVALITLFVFILTYLLF